MADEERERIERQLKADEERRDLINDLLHGVGRVMGLLIEVLAEYVEERRESKAKGQKRSGQSKP